MNSLALTKEQHQEMIEHLESNLPFEACGLLAGRNAKVESVHKVTNQAQSPLRYMMDPIEQLSAFEWIESNGQDLIGIFHSHPTGPEIISPSDIAEAAYAVVYIVIARVDNPPAWHTRGFWIENGTYTEVALEII